MLLFTDAQLRKMKTAELTELIELYVKGGQILPPEPLATNADRIGWILTAREGAGGYPHVLTEEDFVQNTMLAEEDMVVGDVIFIPEPSTEDKAREEMMAQLDDAIINLTEEEQEEVVAKAQDLSLEELNAYIRDIKNKSGLAPTDQTNTGAGTDTKNEEETADNGKSATKSDDVDPIAEAIKTGNFRFESVVIVGYRPKIGSGVLRFELYGANGATYLAEKDVVMKLVDELK